MKPENLPVVGVAFRFGAHDRVLDTYLLLGPLVVLAFVILGRNLFTVNITGLYILSFVAYVVYKGMMADGDH